MIIGCLLHLCCLAEAARTSRWWFHAGTSAYIDQALNIVTTHRDSLTGAYFYYGFGVGQGGVFTASTAPATMRERLAPFLETGLTVGVALGSCLYQVSKVQVELVVLRV